MAAQVTNYKCPSCTGPLHFDGALGKLKCDYCESVYEVAEIEAMFAGKEEAAAEAFVKEEEKKKEKKEKGEGVAMEGEWNMSGAGSEWGAEEAKIRAYSCPSCGAELITDETTAATSCPYCGNPTVVPGQLGGALKPDYVIPFKLDKQAAIDALSGHYKGKKLLPKAFSDRNHIEEIKGVYVPFWLYDATVDASAVFNASRVSTFVEGDYNVTVTEFFDCEREGRMSFTRVPVDGSSKMPDSHMDSIEPYDYRELKPFSIAYLPGYLADKYDVSMEECAKRADTRCKQSAINALRGTVGGYANVGTKHQNLRIRRGDVKYALLPVWMLSTQWNGENFIFAMNGQTGKLIGDLPVDKGRFWFYFLRNFGIVVAVLLVLLLLVFR